jgi:hypothetical protein
VSGGLGPGRSAPGGPQSDINTQLGHLSKRSRRSHPEDGFGNGVLRSSVSSVRPCTPPHLVAALSPLPRSRQLHRPTTPPGPASCTSRPLLPRHPQPLPRRPPCRRARRRGPSRYRLPRMTDH